MASWSISYIKPYDISLVTYLIYHTDSHFKTFSNAESWFSKQIHLPGLSIDDNHNFTLQYSLVSPYHQKADISRLSIRLTKHFEFQSILSATSTNTDRYGLLHWKYIKKYSQNMLLSEFCLFQKLKNGGKSIVSRENQNGKKCYLDCTSLQL